MPKFYFTPRGVDRIEERRRALRGQLREIQGEKGEAAEVGGNQWHDNFSFEELSRQEMMLNSQIAELNRIMDNMVIVRTVSSDADHLSIGQVAVLDLAGERKAFRVGGYDESDLEANPPMIAYNAPLIAPFIGAEAGHQEVIYIGGVARQATLEEILTEVRDEDRS